MNDESMPPDSAFIAAFIRQPIWSVDRFYCKRPGNSGAVPKHDNCPDDSCSLYRRVMCGACEEYGTVVSVADARAEQERQDERMLQAIEASCIAFYDTDAEGAKKGTKSWEAETEYVRQIVRARHRVIILAALEVLK